MFSRLKAWNKKRVFGNTALLEMNAILEMLFTSDEAQEKYPSIRVLKKKGEDTVNEFRKHIIQKVLAIVQKENPLTVMRKELISSVRTECMSRLLFTEEFHGRRQVIYDEFNKKTTDPEMLWSDERAAPLAMWNEAECICLRLLQGSMFEEVSQDDWWTAYVKCCEINFENLYRSLLAKVDGEDSSIYPVMLKAGEDALKDYERKILGVSEP